VSDDEQDAPIRGLAPTIITRPVASLGLVTAAPYGEIVKTVIHGPLPPELEQVIERRRALGQDRLDEVWDGSHHVAADVHFRHAYLVAAVISLLRPFAQAVGLVSSSGFNLGGANDFRVPDGGLHRVYVDALYLDTAAMAIEVRAADDETYEKLPFYAAHGVDEVLVVEPDDRRVRIFALGADGYEEQDRSVLLGLDSFIVQAAISWP